MQLSKLKVLAEAGGVRKVEVLHEATGDGWTVQITYATRQGERGEVLERQRGEVLERQRGEVLERQRGEVLERQRGGARVFTTLDAVARCLAGLGLTGFQVNARGLAGEEPP